MLSSGTGESTRSDTEDTGLLTAHPAGSRDRPWGESFTTRHYALSRRFVEEGPGNRRTRALVIALFAGLGIALGAAAVDELSVLGRASGLEDAGPGPDRPVPAPTPGDDRERLGIPLLNPAPASFAHSDLGFWLHIQAEQQGLAAAAEERRADAARGAAEERRRKREAERAEEEQREPAERPDEQPSDGGAAVVMPLDSYVLTSRFGDKGALWSAGLHTGLDFAAPTGTPVRALAAGVIRAVTTQGPYGNRTVLELEDGTQAWYAHQASLAVETGDIMRPGQTIGTVGETGNVTGPHLHLEIRPPGSGPVDPARWLRDKGLNF
ncbi:peptidoglycan DD-metalloendopeptidase family protein [Streptomyces antibioticus]|uniref:M23 family metallopeptidase n=1 Tax=Streptomyces antibioticus TaxID=1890 RepID=UPI0037165E87